MGGYGYVYQSYTTYNTLGPKTDEPPGPAIRRPLDPFASNTNTRKTVVPIATGPYAGDEYRTHGSPTKAYPTRDDNEYVYRQTSPVHSRPQKVDDFVTKVQNEASRPARFSPEATSDWRHSPRPTGYNTDYGSNGEEPRPFSNPARNDNNYHGNGYGGDYGNYHDKERHKPIGSSNRNDNNYHGNGYVGDYGNYPDKERHKPIGSSTRNDNKYQPPENYSSVSGRPRPSISPGWTAPTRNGTPLSQPTNNIGQALGILKEAAKVSGDYNKGRPKDHEGYNSNYNHQSRHDDVDRPKPSIWDKPPGYGSSDHLREPSEIDKETERLRNINISKPPTPEKGDTGHYYREPVDSMDATRRRDDYEYDQRRHGTLNPASRPTSTIDSWQAQKKYNGARV